jgi:hypothetical protein
MTDLPFPSLPVSGCKRRCCRSELRPQAAGEGLNTVELCDILYIICYERSHYLTGLTAKTSRR